MNNARTSQTVSINPLKKVSIGHTPLTTTQMGFGAGALGDPWYAISEARAQATLQAAFDAGIRYFDTAPWYGNTLSEHRVGHFLRQQPRDQYLVSTKVGRIYLRPGEPGGHAFFDRWQGGLKFKLRFDYTAAGIMRSYEDSLMRMGLTSVDSLVIHDLDLRHQKDEAGVARALNELDAGGGFAALQALKDAGEIKVIGVGINHLGMIPRFIEHFDIDYFLLAMPYTLADQSALREELPLCQQKNIGIVLGAVFGSGILATGTEQSLKKYAYQDVQPDMLARIQKIEALCQEYDVALPAAALQFPLFHPAVNTVIPGCNSVAQVQANIAHLSADIPVAFWQALKSNALIDPAAPLPGDESCD